MFVQAQHFRNDSRGRGDIRRIVIHTAEITESRDSAEDIASFFASIPADAPPSKRVSAHAVADNNSIVGCVRDEDVAFHALGDNDATLGLELSGFAGQTRAQWRDAYSTAMLNRAAVWCAQKAVLYGIEPRWLTAAQERARLSGFVTHKIVSDVFGAGIRSDPGVNFPYEAWMDQVQQEVEKLTVQWVRFELRSGPTGQLLATSSRVREGAAELDRLDTFYGNQKEELLAELRRDGEATFTRVEL